MIGGDRLTGDLLRDWCAQGNLTTRMETWAREHGGAVFKLDSDPRNLAERARTALREGTKISRDYLPQRREIFSWENIGTNQQPPYVPEDTTWLLCLFVDHNSPPERIIVLGPREGLKGKTEMGWRFSRRWDADDGPDSWLVSTKVEGLGSFNLRDHNESVYKLLYGSPHVACLDSDFASVSSAVVGVPILADIFAAMFNQMLDHLVPSEPAKIQAIFPATKANPTTKWDEQLALCQAEVVARQNEAKWESERQIKNYEEVIEKLRAMAVRYQAPPANLQERLQAMLDQGLVSAIKYDHRGIWFLFDQIYGSVGLDEAVRHGVTPGVYRIDPVVILMSYSISGEGWRSGTPTGKVHRHVHAANANRNGFGCPCLGEGNMAPEGFTNASWFKYLWDTDPVEWAKAIHNYFSFAQANGSHQFRGIWTCGALVTADATALSPPSPPPASSVFTVIRISEPEGEAVRAVGVPQDPEADDEEDDDNYTYPDDEDDEE